MDWQAFGFKDDPLQTSPITKSTLALFTGHESEVNICQCVLSGRNVRLVIEGARGVGTTSFANYLRFNQKTQKSYFTPQTEIKVEQGWRLETLLAAIISNFIREIELLEANEALISDERFQNAKSLSVRIAETYRSFGIDIFGFGGSYGKQPGVVSQPVIVPSSTLGHHLEDLIRLVQTAGYTHGALFQLNNLDIGEIHSEAEMKYMLQEVFTYLYHLTNGRLRYVFGLISRLLNRLYVGDLTDKITLDVAKPMLVALGRDRVSRADITTNEEHILSYLVSNFPMTATQIAKNIGKSSQYSGRILTSLIDKNLVSSRQNGRDKFYTPVMDAIIAYGDYKI